MLRFRNVFQGTKSVVIGMIHVGALPGTPLYKGSMEKVIDSACKDAEVYKTCSVDSVMLENMFDIPYLRSSDFGPEIVSAMTKVCCEVQKILPPTIPIGLQILAGGNKEALAVAKVCGLQYIRSEGFVFSHVADEGIIEACAGPLLRYRCAIGAENILIFSDIKKKHSSHAITSDVTLSETAKAAEFFLSDGLIVTGTSTGSPVCKKQLLDVKESSELPVLVGSGTTVENLHDYHSADGFIVGSHFKEKGRWQCPVSLERTTRFMEKIFKLRN